MRTLLLAALATSALASPVLANPSERTLIQNGQDARIYQVQYQNDPYQQERDAREQDRRARDNSGQVGTGDQHGNNGQGGYDQRNVDPYNRNSYNNRVNGANAQHDYDPNDPNGDGSYHAEQHYRSGRNYQVHSLNESDRIYRGRDNRYYCQRSDGTTGLIVGGIGGGLLGNLIAPGGSKTLGTLLGGGLGAVVGNSVGRNRNVRCR